MMAKGRLVDRHPVVVQTAIATISFGCLLVSIGSSYEWIPGILQAARAPISIAYSFMAGLSFMTLVLHTKYQFRRIKAAKAAEVPP